MTDPNTVERSVSGMGTTIVRVASELRKARTTFGNAHEPTQRLFTCVAACLLASLAIVLLMIPWGEAAPLDYVEYPTMDARVRMFAPAAADHDILLITIDDATLERGDLYTIDSEDADELSSNRLAWPWPRHVYNRIIRYCREGGARMVVFDFVFSESGQNTNELLRFDPETGAPFFMFDRAADDLFILEATAREDVLLALTLSGTDRGKVARDELLHDYAIKLDGPNARAHATTIRPRYRGFRSANTPIAGLLDGWPAFADSGRADPEDGFSYIVEFREMIEEDQWMQESPRLRALLPLPQTQGVQGVAGVGAVMGFEDIDGVIRRYDIVAEYGGRHYPTLALDMWRVYVLRYAQQAMQMGDFDGFAERFEGLKLSADGLVVGDRTYSLDASLRDVPVIVEPGRARYLGRTIPLDASGRMRLRFHSYIDYRDLPLYGARPERLEALYGDGRSRPIAVYPEVSANTILADYMALRENPRRAEQGLEPYPLVFGDPADLVKDKVVIVAGTAMALHDLHPIPLGDRIPGTWTIATAFDNIKNQDFMGAPPAWVAWMYALALAVGSVVLVMYSRRFGVSVLAHVGVAALVVGASWVAFKWQVFLPLAAPLAALLSGFSVGAVAKALTEGRQRRQRESFARQYMGKELLDYVIHNPGALKLGGENREMTVFFNDVAGFTTVTEVLGANNPERLVELLNIYLERMTDLMLETGSVIDKYIGDAIMCFWGAPMDMEDHAVRACRGALMCRTELNRMQPLFADAVRATAPQLIKPDGTVLYARAGINSGLMTVGNMGSSKRFAYTVMGDAVNLAARLEPQCKEYGTDILIGQNTEKLVRGEFSIRPIDLMVVKGKTEPIEVFELVGDKAAPQFVQDMLKHYLEGIQLFRDRQFEAALEAFKNAAHHELIQAEGETNPSRLYINRCQDLINNPPPPQWNGVYIKTTK